MVHTSEHRFTMIRLREGYDHEEVDAFVAEVEHEVSESRLDESLVDRIQSVRFNPVRIRPGYDMGEVDQYLDELATRVQASIRSR